MSETQELDPGRLVRYALSWPASMAEAVAAAANAHTMPMAVWVREAIREKLDRTNRGPAFDADGNIRMDAPPGWRPVSTPEEFAEWRQRQEGGQP